MEFDFSAILLGLTVLFGVVWLLDRLFFSKARKAKADASTGEMIEPVAGRLRALVLPGDSGRADPALLRRRAVPHSVRLDDADAADVGDFILVNKFTYGLRLPVFNNKFVSLGEPRRGDVVVFRFPGYLCNVDGRLVRSGDQSCADPHAAVPGQNWIKRVIGLPGDRIETRGSELYINGERVGNSEIGPYKGDPRRPEDQLMLTYGAKVYTEHLGSVDHTMALMDAGSPNDIPNAVVPSEVPKGCYIVMGDNRYNSTDSRWWGCMPEANLVGKAFFVWLSWKGMSTGGIDFSRMGKTIH